MSDPTGSGTAGEDLNSPAMVAMATAIYNARVTHSRKIISDLDLPIARITETLYEIRDCGDDRSAVITLFALIEDLLINLMKRNMNQNLKGGLDRLFQHHNLLGTASSRIAMCAAIGWISPELHNDLELIRKMRNEFAHKVRVRSLTDAPIADWMLALKSNEAEFLPASAAAVQLDGSLIIREISEYTPRQRLVMRSVSIVKKLCYELPCLPLALQHRIHPQDILGELSEMPGAVQDLSRAVIGPMLKIMIVNRPEHWVL
jgi:DNA-binding MltR family transcriptional regulator